MKRENGIAPPAAMDLLLDAGRRRSLWASASASGGEAGDLPAMRTWTANAATMRAG
jgi:hypothetical protein